MGGRGGELCRLNEKGLFNASVISCSASVAIVSGMAFSCTCMGPCKRQDIRQSFI